MMNLAAIIQNQTSHSEALTFYLLAPITVLSALGMLLVKKAVHSALLLATVMITLAIFYILNEAPFLGIVQIIVYTGAVMMLFLFILMLVGVDSADSLIETIKAQRILGIIAAFGVGGLLVALVVKGNLGRDLVGLQMENSNGNVQGIARLIFGQYVWPFEVVSALLITAALGAMVLAHREPDGDKKDQRGLADERVRQSALPVAGLPGPGSFARHNAVDIPALLPDGTPADLSVSDVITARGHLAKPGEFKFNELTDDDREGN